MARVSIFEDRNRWKVRIVDRESGRTHTSSYLTEREARAAAPKLLREYVRPIGVSLEKALAAYRDRLEEGGVNGQHPNKPRTIETTMIRVRSIFSAALGKVVTGELTAKQVEAAWMKFTTTPISKAGKLPSVDTKANTLKQARTFVRWCQARGWMKVDPLAGIVVLGKRKRGKQQLAGRDESRAFLAKALEMARAGDTGALAAAAALLLGARASEITNRIVRGLDDGGRILVITGAKTEAGNRSLTVPEALRPMLLELAKTKKPEEPLFGADASRYWLARAVARVCKASGTTTVTPHGLRGTHATLAVGAGMTGPAVAASLGHESFEGVTARHYATADSIAAARVDRIVENLN